MKNLHLNLMIFFGLSLNLKKFKACVKNFVSGSSKLYKINGPHIPMSLETPV